MARRAGAVKACTDLNEEDITYIPQETECGSIKEFQKAVRAQLTDQKLYSDQYSRMKKNAYVMGFDVKVVN